MQYKDQLVLTGKINDVGAYTRTNIPDSYRLGLELQASANLLPWLQAAANLTLSRNRIQDFTEFVDDYDNGGQLAYAYGETDIAYSPAVIGGATITISPVKPVQLVFLSKYVSDQYLDNTSNKDRKLDAFFTQDFRASYSFNYRWLKNASLIIQANNLFDRKYEPNGYTYSYFYNAKLTTENFYFPMAGRNCMVGVNLRF